MNNSIEQPVTPAENAALTASDDVKRAPKRKVTIIRLYKPEELEKCKKRIRFSSEMKQVIIFHFNSIKMTIKQMTKMVYIDFQHLLTLHRH